MTRSALLTTGALLATALCVLAAARLTRAQEGPAGEQAVEAGRRALRESSSYPWYDPKTDELRRVDVQPDKSAENLNRQSQWQSTPPTPLPTLPSLGWLGTILRVMITLAGLALFGLVIWLLVRAFLNREAGAELPAGGTVAEDRRGDVDRIENLPFQVRRPQSNLRGEAQRNYEAGNYREAIIYLYSYMLVQLDRHQVIRLTKGKTNRQYLREVRQRPGLAPMFEATMIAFEDVFFGDHALTRAEFEACWNRLDEFERLVEQQQQVAA